MRLKTARELKRAANGETGHPGSQASLIDPGSDDVGDSSLSECVTGHGAQNRQKEHPQRTKDRADVIYLESRDQC